MLSDSSQELYEPLWDELYLHARASNVVIGGIWVADVAHMGLSYVLNEEKLGNDRNSLWLWNRGMCRMLMSTRYSSLMERSFKRSASYHQPLSRSNAATSSWDRPQYGRG